jgi:hypothetical protein
VSACELAQLNIGIIRGPIGSQAFAAQDAGSGQAARTIDEACPAT